MSDVTYQISQTWITFGWEWDDALCINCLPSSGRGRCVPYTVRDITVNVLEEGKQLVHKWKQLCYWRALNVWFDMSEPLCISLSFCAVILRGSRREIESQHWFSLAILPGVTCRLWYKPKWIGTAPHRHHVPILWPSRPTKTCPARSILNFIRNGC